MTESYGKRFRDNLEIGLIAGRACAQVSKENPKAVAEAIPEMAEALKEMLFHFGKPKRDEWMNQEAFEQAIAADKRARALLSRLGIEGKG